MTTPIAKEKAYLPDPGGLELAAPLVAEPETRLVLLFAVIAIALVGGLSS